MDKKSKVARIIESETDGIKIKILEIEFPYENDIKALFTPKLENIGFIAVDQIMTVNLKNPIFREQFNDWTERFLEKINSNDSSEILIEKKERKILIDKIINISSNMGIETDNITIIALGVPSIFGGAIITEVVFSVNGIGSQLINALFANDLPLVMTVTFIFAMLIVLFNIIADVLYGVLDPRIRYD